MGKSFLQVDPETCTFEEGEAEEKRLENLVGFYETKQLALKKFINSVYGATASKYFTAHNTLVAESITLQGQDLNHFSENSVNAYFKGIFQNDTELHKKLGITTEAARKVTIGGGRVTEMKPLVGKDYEYLHGDIESLTIAGDTDSVDGNTIVKIDNSEKKICDLFTDLKYENHDIVMKLPNGTEIVSGKDHTSIGINPDTLEKVTAAPVNYVMRHKVSKKRYRITDVSGKSVVVTEDHSCMVMRDGILTEVKPKDIRQESDLLIVY